MQNFRVYFNVLASTSVDVKAKSFSEALKIARQTADLSDAEASDWDFDNPGEIENLDTEVFLNISDIEED